MENQTQEYSLAFSRQVAELRFIQKSWENFRTIDVNMKNVTKLTIRLSSVCRRLEQLQNCSEKEIQRQLKEGRL